jgi:hypothetical protein
VLGRWTAALPLPYLASNSWAGDGSCLRAAIAAFGRQRWVSSQRASPFGIEIGVGGLPASPEKGTVAEDLHPLDRRLVGDNDARKKLGEAPDQGIGAIG